MFPKNVASLGHLNIANPPSLISTSPISISPMPHVVIIGGLFAGCNATKVLRNLGADVTLVLALSQAYFNCAAPRLLVEPDVAPKTLFSLEDFAKKHGATFVHATAVASRLDKNEVDVEGENGLSTLTYDFLVVATGTVSGDAGFKTGLLAQESVEAIKAWGAKINAAETVAILGAGATGVECAGEIAHEWGKKVTLYGPQEPLQAFNLPGAQTKLEKLGVEFVQLRSTRVVPGPNGASVEFEDGLVRTFDVVLNTTHYEPLLDFLPASVKDEAGYVVTDDRLVVKNHPNVFALGDILAGGARLVVDLSYGQLPVFAATAKQVIAGQTGKQPTYTPYTNTVLVPISRQGGEGRLFGWWTPNILVRLFKARDFMVGQAPAHFT